MLKRSSCYCRNIFKKVFNKMAENLMDSGVKRTKPTDEDEDVCVKKVKVDDEAPPPMQGRLDRRRKVALLLAYCGAGYYGIQIQKDFPTIESELLSSLVKGNFIAQEHADSPQKIQFQRAARTDKGVSAVGNVISLKMLINCDDVVEKINEGLPKQIKVISYVRATRGFNSKNFCDSRTYMYMIPTYAFATSDKLISDDFRIDDVTMKKLQDVLSMFKGTHNFHNFTSGVKPTDPSAKRYIISFESDKPIVEDGIEFVILTVKGQSFMLHHIRKMIALAISVVKGACNIETIDKAWLHDKMDVPKAPSEGLFLYQTHYNGYNKRYGADGMHDPIDWTHCRAESDEFMKTYITSHIIKSEKTDRVVLQWLDNLRLHKFDTRKDNEHLKIDNQTQSAQPDDGKTEIVCTSTVQHNISNSDINQQEHSNGEKYKADGESIS